MSECPFKPGDKVKYSPSVRGRAMSSMTDYANLRDGGTYIVARIDPGGYVVLQGRENSPEGGLYWTEFTSAD